MKLSFRPRLSAFKFRAIVVSTLRVRDVCRILNFARVYVIMEGNYLVAAHACQLHRTWCLYGFKFRTGVRHHTTYRGMHLYV